MEPQTRHSQQQVMEQERVFLVLAAASRAFGSVLSKVALNVADETCVCSTAICGSLTTGCVNDRAARRGFAWAVRGSGSVAAVMFLHEQPPITGCFFCDWFGALFASVSTWSSGLNNRRAQFNRVIYGAV